MTNYAENLTGIVLPKNYRMLAPYVRTIFSFTEELAVRTTAFDDSLICYLTEDIVEIINRLLEIHYNRFTAEYKKALFQLVSDFVDDTETDTEVKRAFFLLAAQQLNEEHDL